MNDSENKAMRTIIKIIIGIILLIFFMKYTDKCGEPIKLDESDYTFMSYSFAKDAVKVVLKAPSTAVFCDYDKAKIQKNGNEYTITAYVDSENSYSAMLRSEFTIVVKRGENEWTCESLIFDGKIIK